MASLLLPSGAIVIANSVQEAFAVKVSITQAQFEELMGLIVDEKLGQEPGTSLASGEFERVALARTEQEREGIAVNPIDPEFALSTRELPLQTMEPGADLRDSGFSPGPAGGLPAVIGVAALVRLLAPGLATRATPIIRGLAPVGGSFSWGSLPSWLQSALAAVGATVGITMLMDLPGTGGITGISVTGNGDLHGVHLPHDLSAHIVGSWVANEVLFYRLSDGRLAVQNKKGRWKVWRPKKPIVIMPTGAVDLRTMLRADAVLNKQAKRLAAMLNRRAPRPRRSKTAAVSDSVIVIDGKAVTK